MIKRSHGSSENRKGTVGYDCREKRLRASFFFSASLLLVPGGWCVKCADYSVPLFGWAKPML